MSYYAADGSVNVTVVDGNSRTGRYASDGSINVVLATSPVTAPIGMNHPCGAMWVTVVSAGTNYRYAADGSINVSESPFLQGPLRVTAVSGDLTPGGGIPGASGTPMGLLLLLTYA